MNSSGERKATSQSLKCFVFRNGIMRDQQVGPGFPPMGFFMFRGMLGRDRSGLGFGKNILLIHLINAFGFTQVLGHLGFDNKIRLISFITMVVNLKVFPPRLDPF